MRTIEEIEKLVKEKFREGISEEDLNRSMNDPSPYFSLSLLGLDIDEMRNEAKKESEAKYSSHKGKEKSYIEPETLKIEEIESESEDSPIPHGNWELPNLFDTTSPYWKWFVVLIIIFLLTNICFWLNSFIPKKRKYYEQTQIPYTSMRWYI